MLLRCDVDPLYDDGYLCSVLSPSLSRASPVSCSGVTVSPSLNPGGTQGRLNIQHNALFPAS